MIDYLIYKVECFDLEGYQEELQEYSPNGIMILAKWADTQELWVKDRLIFKFSKNFYWNIFMTSLIMFWYILRYRPRLLVIENTYLCSLVGWIRKIGLVKKLVYFGGDWLPNPVFKICDYLSCKWADVTWDTTPLINQERLMYWKKGICKENLIYVPRLRKNFITNTAKGVLFLGTIREDSGLELCRNIKPFRLRTPKHCPREEFKQRFLGCFCGINLITSKNSWTIYTTPSKIFDYIQFGLPPIVTNNCGYIANLIKTYQLGIVINQQEGELMKALVNIYHNKDFYRKNIERFIKSVAEPRLKEVYENIVLTK